MSAMRSDFMPRPFATALERALCQRQRVHRATARCADAFEVQQRFLEQTIEHSPGERTVRAAALQSRVQRAAFAQSRRRRIHALDDSASLIQRRKPAFLPLRHEEAVERTAFFGCAPALRW